MLLNVEFEAVEIALQVALGGVQLAPRLVAKGVAGQERTGRPLLALERALHPRRFDQHPAGVGYDLPAGLDLRLLHRPEAAEPRLCQFDQARGWPLRQRCFDLPLQADLASGKGLAAGQSIQSQV